jgi:C1A family cysteine protease
MAQQIKWYGWRPDLPDHRDFRYSVPRRLLVRLPSKTDLRKFCPPVYNQGNLGSCTANAIGGAFEFGQMKQDKKKDFLPSRLFIYYNERVMEHSVNFDSGAAIRDGMKSVNQQGVCPEKMFPYNIEKFTLKPSLACYRDALNHQVLSYHRIDRSLAQFRGCLAEGFPFVFGFTVYSSFESEVVARTGKINMPKKDEDVLGGHAVMAVGYDDSANRFIVRNSWGADWGLKGYFTMPYDYLTDENLSDDFWTIRMVE